MVDWNDPSSRAEHVAAVGIERYNADHEAHIEASIVAVENGYGIRPVQTRFGRLMQVMDTDEAFRSLAQAKAHARKLPPGKRKPMPATAGGTNNRRKA